MKSLHSLSLFIVVLCYGCTSPVDLESERDALMATDKAWSETVTDTDAFVSFVADDARFMPFGAPLAVGDAIPSTWEAVVSTPGFGLQWQATDAKVAASGDMGYTIGTFELTTDQEDSTILTQGKYVTIWGKQADGSWKVLVDCFNSDGPPTVVGG